MENHKKAGELQEFSYTANVDEGSGKQGINFRGFQKPRLSTFHYTQINRKTV